MWECTAVWVHCAYLPNAEVCPASDSANASSALDVIGRYVESAQYTLLVNPDGMNYDPRRFGGDHQVNLPDGRRMTFSVRRGQNGGVDNDGYDHKILLAIVWDAQTCMFSGRDLSLAPA